MLTSVNLKARSCRSNYWRRRRIERRRKERGRLIYAVLEHLYGGDQARSMWSAYLRSKQGNDRLGRVS